jgi:hypothetical protein
VSYSWNEDTNDWAGIEKREYNYDSNGKQTLEAIFDGWNANTNKWIGRNKYEYSYDDSSNTTLYVSYVWDVNTNDWLISKKDYYYYRQSTTEINDVILPALRISPNPAHDMLYIESDITSDLNYCIYDLNGRVYLTGLIVDKRINVSGLSKGVYILRLSSQSKMIVQKMVIE